MNRKYEVLLLLDSKLEKEDIDKTIADVEAKLGGNIVKKEEWGLKDLAYEINKAKKAYYVLYYIETTSEAIASLKDMIAIDKRIVRPMILRHEKKWPYEYKTAKDLKFPERKKREFTRSPRPEGAKPESAAPKQEVPAEKPAEENTGE